ncbi:proton extrusion protein PcxA [Calothrix sp. NIES-3974]|uniref:proton extrusion protein PcxA n=1 Tax=Calothrix sp. NIES-3974 TaxID=2005462 RepID=UPI000B614DC7|nr:proton extrusion protein PcxA [Calothrix sp. NIES-3974]BAZ04648.1 proton extrusion protein PcxA [Calothrix sp. NIES-3974]
MSNLSLWQRTYNYLVLLYKWYLRTPERSLETAYQAALSIKKIEEEYFNGGIITTYSSQYSSLDNYFTTELNKQLKIVRMRLTEFNSSRTFLRESDYNRAPKYGVTLLSSTVILEKLQFIDSVIGKYINYDDNLASVSIPTNSPQPSSNIVSSNPQTDESPIPNQSKSLQYLARRNKGGENRSKANTTGILPRSILSTVSRIQVELDPDAEKDVLQNFRKAQRRTIISVRFILLLIIIPVLTHQLSKAFVIGPIVNYFHPVTTSNAFINNEMEEKAFAELAQYEEHLRFQAMIGNAPVLSESEREEKLQAKAKEIAYAFSRESSNAIKNVFADICSMIALVIFLLSSQPQIAVLKDFFDHVVYGLSDSAKAFIIILFTDIFVGFHSPHGWEVILEGISRHWGLPANHEFIFLFIATFPVILDTIFKYWIFRYLNRVSPSAVATYRNMNE